MDNQSYQEEFIRVYADLLNTAHSSAALLPVVDEVEGALIQDMPGPLSKWNGNYNTWQAHMSTIRNFIANRVVYCRSHLQSQFGLVGTYNLSLNISPSGSGRIELAAAEIDGPFTGVYFQGVPLYLRAVANDGYVFAGWTPSSAGQRAEIQINPTSNYSVSATFTPTGGGANITLNEIQYNPARSADSEDWVELYNPSPQSVSLAGWELRDEASVFAIPAGTMIPAGGYLVLCSDLAAFSAQFPTVANAVGDLGFGLSGGGERIELHAPDGLHDSVEYDDSAPWPSGPDGGGTTLELIDAGTDNTLPSSWAESAVLGGTPGGQNTVTP